jgi:hypothetical protein
LDEIVDQRLNDEHELNSASVVDSDFDLIDKKESALSNYSSFEILYSIKKYSIFNDYLKIFEIWTKIGDKVYIFEYKSDLQSYNDYLPIVNHMIESIEINPPAISPLRTDLLDKIYLICFLIFLLIVIFALYIIKRKFSRRKRQKHKERRGFAESVKEEVLRSQKNRCAHCKRSLHVFDFDHIDNDRSNNDISNCQALCPNCHAIKTRKGIIEHRSRIVSSIGQKILKFVLRILLIVIILTILSQYY